MKIRNQYKNPSGLKDYFYEEGFLKEEISKLIKDRYMKSGFFPMETSILNNSEILSSKYGGGSEILKEMYTLTDQAERDLALRYDLTVPFIKYMGMNPSLKFPVKRFEVGKVFRNGPVKKGRLREFTQCDADILGVTDVMAEAELLLIVMDILEILGLNVTVEINNIKIIKGLLEYMEVEEDLYKGIILILDKQKKISRNELLVELKDKGLSESKSEWLLNILDSSLNSSSELKNLGSSLIFEGFSELEKLQYLLERNNVKWNPYLARGLEIYTGSIYEIFIDNGQVTSSVASGGRYDNVIGEFLNNKMVVPAVGISIGLDVLMAELTEKDLGLNSDVDYLIIPLGKEKEALKLAMDLRRKGYVVEVEMVKKKLSKALKYANNNGYNKVLILGDEEVSRGVFKEKDLVTGIERELSILDI